MAKGLRRSIERAEDHAALLFRRRIPIDVTYSLTSIGSSGGFGNAEIFQFPPSVDDLMILGARCSLNIQVIDPGGELTDPWTGSWMVGSLPKNSAATVTANQDFCELVSDSNGDNFDIEMFASPHALMTELDRRIYLNTGVGANDITNNASQLQVRATGFLRFTYTELEFE